MIFREISILTYIENKIYVPTDSRLKAHNGSGRLSYMSKDDRSTTKRNFYKNQIDEFLSNHQISVQSDHIFGLGFSILFVRQETTVYFPFKSLPRRYEFFGNITQTSLSLIKHLTEKTRFSWTSFYYTQ